MVTTTHMLWGGWRRVGAVVFVYNCEEWGGSRFGVSARDTESQKMVRGGLAKQLTGKGRLVAPC